MNIAPRKEIIQAMQLLLCIVLSAICTFEIIFLALPVPHMDVMRATQPVSAYYGQIDEQGDWNFQLTTIRKGTICIVRRTFIVFQTDDTGGGRYIEVVTTDQRLLYIKVPRSVDHSEPFPQNMDIVSFPVPPPWRSM